MSGLTITVDTLGKRFKREWIFRKLTRQFTAGIYAVVGPNGSGKSTLLQVLWGQMLPSAGSLTYEKNGKVIDIQNVFNHLSIATPYLDLVDEFTLKEQVDFHFSMKAIRNGLSGDELIRLMELGHASDKPIGNFSSGMKQRVKLGLAFHTQADVIFLDEPGTNLDAQAFGWYQEQLKGVPASGLLFIASNQPAEYPENAIKIDIQSLK